MAVDLGFVMDEEPEEALVLEEDAGRSPSLPPRGGRGKKGKRKENNRAPMLMHDYFNINFSEMLPFRGSLRGLKFIL